MFKIIKRISIVCLCFCLWSGNAVIRAYHETDPWTFSFYFENDLFTGTDMSYTNGVKLSWISPDLSSYAQSDALPDWSLPVIQRLPFINEPDLQRNLTFSIGQNMYTPSDIAREDLMEDERPYAGWTYLGVAFHSKSSERLDSLELQIGIVGPWSLAEYSQKFIHEIRGLQQPNGWHHQIGNEPGIAAVYERKWRLLQEGVDVGGLGFDFITHLGATVGNVYTYANTGFEVRWGWNIPTDFGSSVIRPGGDTNAPMSGADPRLNAGYKHFSLNLFGMVDGRGVLRDIFLDGNTFSDSHSVEKKHFVMDVAMGVSLLYRRFKISYMQVMRTKEFEKQEKNHSFGSIAISYTY